MGVKITGIEKLQAKLKKNVQMKDVKRVIKTNGAQLQSKMVRNANFVKGYQTGTTKRSINLNVTDFGLSAEVGPTTEYSPYVEWGTRFMDAQPFVKPSLEEQEKKFEKDMKKLAK
ncbi:MAG: HK97-gp10 family putative phage morphogenesis protein [Thomasclavelia sp.]